MMGSSSSAYQSTRNGDSRYNNNPSPLLNDPFTDSRGESPSFHSNVPLNESKSSNNNSYLNSSIGSHPGSSSMMNMSSSSSSQHKNRVNELIKHKQQRLLLLHHSSICKANKGECKVSRYCADMKKLWRHIVRGIRCMECKLKEKWKPVKVIF